MQSIVDFLISIFREYGYILVFLGLFLENMFVIGIFFPGETFFVLAAFLAAEGDLKLVYLIPLAICGATLGNVIGYFIGLKGGDTLLNRLGRSGKLTKRIETSKEFFEEHGTRTVFLARFAAGVRSFTPAIAGTMKMNFGLFFWYSFSAITIWTLLVAALGFFFGSNLAVIVKLINRVGLAVFVVFLVLAFILFKKSREKKPHT